MDRTRLMRVFENLLENAIQHSPRGGQVSVEVRRADGSVDAIECVVEDSGPGIAAEDLPHVFEPFFTRRKGGTGLGLSIVQRIVEQHGGEVLVANRPHGGTAVTVRLRPRRSQAHAA
jgi:signal transduction histidine kinase